MMENPYSPKPGCVWSLLVSRVDMKPRSRRTYGHIFGLAKADGSVQSQSLHRKSSYSLLVHAQTMIIKQDGYHSLHYNALLGDLMTPLSVPHHAVAQDERSGLRLPCTHERQHGMKCDYSSAYTLHAHLQRKAGECS